MICTATDMISIPKGAKYLDARILYNSWYDLIPICMQYLTCIMRFYMPAQSLYLQVRTWKMKSQFIILFFYLTWVSSFYMWHDLYSCRLDVWINYNGAKNMKIQFIIPDFLNLNAIFDLYHEFVYGSTIFILVDMIYIPLRMFSIPTEPQVRRVYLQAQFVYPRV